MTDGDPDDAADVAEHHHGDGCLWPLEPHTEAKHRLYKRYVSAWFPILLQLTWVNKVTYLDAFSGPGEYANGEDGSPTFALRGLLEHERRGAMRLSRDRVTMIFLDADRARCGHLRWRLEQEFGDLDALPVQVVIEQGRAERDTLDVLTRHQAWREPILAVFDSFGSVRVPHTTMRRIADNKASEVVVTFGPNWFSRRASLNQDIFDQVFGSREAWRQEGAPTEPGELWRYWLDTYERSLLRAGFVYTLPFQILAVSGVPLYLIYATKSDKGVLEFKNAMWQVDTTDGMRFNDPRTNAARKAELDATWPSLFDEDPDVAPTELRGFVLDLLEQRGPATVEEIGQFLLTQTARWRPKDARWAARQLLADNMVTRTPAAGQLTRRTVLSRVVPARTPGTPSAG